MSPYQIFSEFKKTLWIYAYVIPPGSSHRINRRQPQNLITNFICTSWLLPRHRQHRMRLFQCIESAHPGLKLVLTQIRQRYACTLPAIPRPFSRMYHTPLITARKYSFFIRGASRCYCTFIWRCHSSTFKKKSTICWTGKKGAFRSG